MGIAQGDPAGSSRSGNRLTRFVAADHRYVFLGTSAIALVGMWLSSQPRTEMSFLAGVYALEVVMYYLLFAWVVVSGVALLNKLIKWRDYASTSPFVRPGARKAERIASYVVVAITAVLFVDRVVMGFIAVAQAAVARVDDAKVLSDLVATDRPDMPACAFARLLEIKAFDAAADAVCKYPVERLTSDGAEKLVAKFTDAKSLEKFARGAKSPSVVKAAVAQISDDNVLFEVARDAKDEELFKLALGRIGDQKVFESITLAGGERSDYAISLLKDGAYVLSLLNKGEAGGVRNALAKKLEVKDISAEMCEKESDGAVREILRARASDDVKAELTQRRNDRVKKAIAVAENDAKELGALFARVEPSRDDVQALAEAYKGRAILFKKAKVREIGRGRDASGKMAKIVTFSGSPPKAAAFFRIQRRASI